MGVFSAEGAAEASSRVSEIPPSTGGISTSNTASVKVGYGATGALLSFCISPRRKLEISGFWFHNLKFSQLCLVLFIVVFSMIGEGFQSLFTLNKLLSSLAHCRD